MNHIILSERGYPLFGVPHSILIRILSTFLILAFVTFLSLHQLTPPRAARSDTPLTEFSAERAMKSLEVIARRPHPIGSPGHEEVRNYIIRELTAMGYAPVVQTRQAIRGRKGYAFVGANVENVFVKLQGTSNTKAVMLVGHYDSAPTGPGASDDGSAIATMLETLRAVRSGPPLRNDLLF